MPAASSEAPRVSVILPVYNTADYLAACLDSLVAQDIEDGAMEVIAVDDGSTDGSGELLGAYAERHPSFRVIHQENSGWPGRPRNRGIELSRGTYLFFMDSDDWLGPETVRRVADFADEHRSDVVVPRIVYTGAPAGKRRAWKTAVDADLRRVFKSLSPQKLFRREFVEKHGLRFPEGEVRLEDGIFVTHAYLLGSRVSLLGGYDFYFKRRRDESDNISLRRIDPAGYVSSLRRIADNVVELCDDERLARDLVHLLYNRKGLTRLVKGRRYARTRRADFTEWVESLAAFADAYVPAGRDARLPARRRRLSEAVRERDVGRAASIAESLAAGRRRNRSRDRTGRGSGRRVSSAGTLGRYGRRMRRRLTL